MNAPTLGIINANFLQNGMDRHVFYVLGYGLQFQGMGDFVHGIYHNDVSRAVGDVLDKGTVNLKVIDIEAFEIRIRRIPRAKIIQGKFTSKLLDFPNKPLGKYQTGCSHGFGHFKGDLIWRDILHSQTILEEIQKVLGVKGLPGQIDGKAAN